MQTHAPKTGGQYMSGWYGGFGVTPIEFCRSDKTVTVMSAALLPDREPANFSINGGTTQAVVRRNTVNTEYSTPSLSLLRQLEAISFIARRRCGPSASAEFDTFPQPGTPPTPYCYGVAISSN
jgi:hypothetical protein